jgi:hypothetical protein
MNHSVLACPKLWDDVKSLQKNYKRKELFPTLEFNDETEDSTKISSIPLIYSVTVFFSNSCKGGHVQIDLWGTQPYLDKGWKIWKFRYAFAGKSKQDGLRILMAENEEHSSILAILIQMKNKCANEAKLQKEVLSRLENFFQED